MTTLEMITRTIEEALEGYIHQTGEDVDVTEFGLAVSNIVKENYGKHNYEDFLKAVNENLKF